MLRRSICNSERNVGRYIQRHFSCSGKEALLFMKPRMVHAGNAAFHRNALNHFSISKISETNLSTNLRRRLLSSTPAATPKEGKKEVSDIFFDNVGTLFLATIALIIGALVRSSYSSSNRVAAREILEKKTELDPSEIHDLRLANGPDFNKQVMDTIIHHFLTQNGGDNITSQKMTYTSFVSHVLRVMRNNYDPRFTIQLGHLLDRLALKIVQQRQKDSSAAATDNEDDDKLDLDLLLTILSLAMHSTVQERVDILFQIMTSSSSHQQINNNDAKDEFASETNMMRMIDHLQKTCQLVSDAQILETKGDKYPTQKYHVATSDEMIALAKESQKDKISQQALEQQQWDCHDFHILLRSKAVCPWGECYHKTNLTTNE